MTAVAKWMDRPGSPIREERVARSTGTRVLMEDLYHPDAVAGVPEEGGRWALVCEPHGGLCQFETMRDARDFMARPEEWCPTCQEAD